MQKIISQVKTSAAVLSALSTASHKRMSQGDMLEQRVSFVYGSVKDKSGVTRDQIRQVISGDAQAVQPVK